MISISYISNFKYGFDFPTGAVIVGSELFVVDNQNDVVKVFDLTGAYQRQITGFSYPNDIATDGTDLYISDRGTDKVLKYDVSGSYIGEITGFDIPQGLWFDTYLYVSDNQNGKVKRYTDALVFVDEIIGLNYPTGVTVFDSQIVVCDFDGVKFFDAAFTLQKTEVLDIYNVKTYENVLFLIDNQNGKIIVYDENYEYDDLFYPRGLAYNDGRLYVTDSTNTVFVLNYSATDVSDNLVLKFVNLTRQLYPTSRAWILKLGSVFEKFHKALSKSEARAYDVIRSLTDSILPDNDDFSEADALNWERALGMFQQTELYIETRKQAIARKYNHPGTQKNRQHYKYIEAQLQAAGFDAYIYENRTPYVDPRITTYGTPFYGEDAYGGTSIIGGYEVIANYVEPEKDLTYNIGADSRLFATFFIGGSTFGSRATIPSGRKLEFRELVLTLKPAQTVAAWVTIDTPVDDTLLYETGGSVSLESDENEFLILETDT